MFTRFGPVVALEVDAVVEASSLVSGGSEVGIGEEQAAPVSSSRASSQSPDRRKAGLIRSWNQILTAFPLYIRLLIISGVSG